MAEAIQMIPNTLHILIVDDNQELLNTLSKFFTGKGIQVDTECCGLGGVQRFTKHPDKYDAILLDVQMPDIDGYETARRIRENMKDKRPPIIAMSGNASQVDKSIFDFFIRKPFKYDDLLNRMIAVINS